MNDTATLPAIARPRNPLEPQTFEEAVRFADAMAKSNMVPAEYRGKPENILLAVHLGKELGLGPLQAVQSIATINGKPSVYGDALLALVKGSPVCDDVIEGFEGSGDALTAVCEARRKGKAPSVVRFSVADAKKAGLWGKTGPWQQYPRRMLQMRARGFALRDAFADVLRGVITREEAEDYPVDVSQPREPIDITPRSDLDQFAAQPGVDAETGEIVETGEPVGADALREVAHQAAYDGTEAFRTWWKTLSKEERATLKPGIAAFQHEANDADARRAAERDDDPFSSESARPKPASTADYAKLLRALEPPRADLASEEPDWHRYAEGMIELIGRADAAAIAATLFSNLPHMKRLRASNGDEYRRVMDAVRGRAAQPASAESAA